LAAKPEKREKNDFHQTTVVWRLNWKNQMDGQKLKELSHSETQLAVCSRDTQSLSERKRSAATQIKYLQLPANHCVEVTGHSRRDSKVIAWNRRKPPNQRSCFLSELKAARSYRHLRRGHAESIRRDAASAEPEN
jgi:hypothetical protein